MEEITEKMKEEVEEELNIYEKNFRKCEVKETLVIREGETRVKVEVKNVKNVKKWSGLEERRGN